MTEAHMGTDEAFRLCNVTMITTVDHLIAAGLVDKKEGQDWAGRHAVIRLEKRLFAHVWKWFWPESKKDDSLAIVEVKP